LLAELKRGALFTIVGMLLFGAAYHLALWAVAAAVFPSQAEGSLIRRSDGSVAGSRLIAQAFTRPEYFHPRPSAVDYNAASTGGSNLGPSNPDHLAAVAERLKAVTALEGTPSRVPSEMVTTSGSGLDPDLPPAATDLQASRVARARNVPVDRIRELIRSHTRPPAFGFLGRERVNILELNLALDESLPASPSSGR
jgi:K+-transporting ATPase ATPase C chain